MQRLRSLTSAAVIVLLAVPSFTLHAASPDFSAVDAHLDANLPYFARMGQNPAVYVEVRRDGEMLHSYQAGVIERETAVPFASATKLLSAAVILSLTERPEWGLHDPMADTVVLMNSYNMQTLTPYHGFTMSAGLCSNPDLGASCPGYEVFSFLTLEQSAFLIITNIPVHHPPLTVMAYDGSGMQLVGYTATRIFNKPWNELADETIVDRLGMNATSYSNFGSNPAIAGGLVSSAADYLVLLEMIANGGVHDGEQILSPESIETLWVNHTQGFPITRTPFANKDDIVLPYGAEELHYGFGAWILAQNPDTGLVEEINSPGAFGTYPWIDRKRDITGILVTDMPAGSRGSGVEFRMMQLIREAIDVEIKADHFAIH